MFGRLLLLCILLRIPSTVFFFVLFFRGKVSYSYEVFDHKRGTSRLFTTVQLSLLY